MNELELENRRVLVIDDDIEVQHFYRKALAKNERPDLSALSELNALLQQTETAKESDSSPTFELITATQGEEGIERLLEQHEQGREVAVAFVDVRIPPGINGLETARRLREIDPDLVIVIVSAYSDFSMKEFRESIDDQLYFLQKPPKAEELEHMACITTKSWNVRRTLRLEQQQSASILRSISDGILVLDENGDILQSNDAFEALSGRPQQQLLGASYLDLIQLQRCDNCNLGSLDHSSLTDLQDLINTTGSLNHLQIACEQSGVASLITTPNGDVEWINTLFQKQFGWTIDQLKQSGLNGLIPNDHHQAHEQLVTQFIHSGESRRMGNGRNLPLRKRDGETIEVEIGRFSLQTPQGNRGLAIINDPDRAETWNRFTYTQLGRMILPAGATGNAKLLRADGNSIPIELSISTILLSSESERTTLVIRNMTWQIERETMQFNQAYHAGVTENSAEMLHKFGNGLSYVRYYLTQLLHSEKNLEQLASRIHSTPDEIDSELIGKALHEFNQDTFGERLQESIDLIRRSSEELQQIQELSEQGKALHHNQFDLHLALHTAVTPLRDTLQQVGIDLSIEIAPTLRQVSLPQPHLIQVVKQLVENAIEALLEPSQRRDEGKTPQIRLSVQPLPATTIAEARIMILVEDNGPGLPESAEQRLQLFRPRFTTKPGHAGEGLHFAGNFAVRLGGAITAEKRPEGGALFRLVLPLTAESKEPDAAEPSS